MSRVQGDNEALIGAYRQCFNSPAGQIVLLDLMKFCKFRVPCTDQIDEGKRQAFLRIENFLALSPEQIHALFRGQMSAQQTGDDDE